MRGSAVLAAIAAVAVVALGGCASTNPGSSVPSLSGGAGGAASAQSGAPDPGASGASQSRPRVGYSTSRVAQLHAAAQCLREHGVPNYQDPVLTADGYVYTDSRAIQDATAKMSRDQQDEMENALRQACGQLFVAAGLRPDDQSPAPQQLVQAGVRAARCLRANGMPNYRDPTAETQFTPGHGFGTTADEMPNNGALGKQDPLVQQAFGACRQLLDAEIAASSLGNLAHD
jgi:hypothetical protein